MQYSDWLGASAAARGAHGSATCSVRASARAKCMRNARKRLDEVMVAARATRAHAAGYVEYAFSSRWLAFSGFLRYDLRPAFRDRMDGGEANGIQQAALFSDDNPAAPRALPVLGEQ